MKALSRDLKTDVETTTTGTSMCSLLVLSSVIHCTAGLWYFLSRAIISPCILSSAVRFDSDSINKKHCVYDTFFSDIKQSFGTSVTFSVSCLV